MMYVHTYVLSLFSENVIMIEFEQDLYEEFEDIGLDDFALRVCMRISNVTSERTIRVSTASGTAIGKFIIKSI